MLPLIHTYSVLFCSLLFAYLSNYPFFLSTTESLLSHAAATASHTHLLCSVLFAYLSNYPSFLSTTESLLLHAAATGAHTHLLCSVVFCSVLFAYLSIYQSFLYFYNRVIIVTCCSDCCSYESQHSTGSQTRARQIPFRDC